MKLVRVILGVLGLGAACWASAGSYRVTYDVTGCKAEFRADHVAPFDQPYTVGGRGDGMVRGGGGHLDSTPDKNVWGKSSVNCLGTVTVRFDWESTSGEAPPSLCVVKLYSAAVWQGSGGNAANGQGDPAVGNSMGATSSGTHYQFKQYPGYSFSLTVTPTAYGENVPPRRAPASAMVYVDASSTVVTIESDNAYHVGRGFAFALGQKADFYVSAPGYVVDQHVWSPGSFHVDGVVLGTPIPSSSFSGEWYSNHRTTLFGTSHSGDPHPFWYYEFKSRPNASVRCTFRLCTLEEAVLGTFTIERKLAIWVPQTSAHAEAGPTTIFDPDRVCDNESGELAQAGSELLSMGRYSLLGDHEAAIRPNDGCWPWHLGFRATL